MLESRLRKGWRLIRLCRGLIGRHSLYVRTVSNSRKLSCKLLVHGMKLGKSLLELWRKLSLRKSTIPMAMAMTMTISSCMCVVV